MTKVKIIPDRVAERAFASYVEDANGCHISTYGCNSRGYPQIGWHVDHGKRDGTTASRAAWVHVHGQFAEPSEIRLLPDCDKRCVNVGHMRKLSQIDSRRRVKNDFPLGMSCRRNHPESSRSDATGECRDCLNEDNRDRWRKMNPEDRKKKLATPNYGLNIS
ncbi:homoendonuclease [Mycobacterium phage Gaia]|uniref:Homoendonuclease n=1 Tax=Mycobacterium phage Gaia TaxID=1486472 RepID=A0A068F1M0_9CAUD|nr:homoendonuclease [Mycobacterium phage Gaia]AID58837.1 homoendonuclease [Mycobacterium phage Gaia]AYQ99960.1 HNH endonuclease [Mycobacterium phage Nebkiss]